MKLLGAVAPIKLLSKFESSSGTVLSTSTAAPASCSKSRSCLSKCARHCNVDDFSGTSNERFSMCSSQRGALSDPRIANLKCRVNPLGRSVQPAHKGYISASVHSFILDFCGCQEPAAS